MRERKTSTLDRGGSPASPLRRQAEQALLARASALARSEQGLREGVRALQSILDSLGDGLLVADPRGRLVLSNAAADRMRRRFLPWS